MASGIQKLLANVPSAVFAASLPGVSPYSLGQRLACLAVKFGEYSLAGMACGLVGQGVCNGIMNWRRAHFGTKVRACLPMFKEGRGRIPPSLTHTLFTAPVVNLCG